METNYPTLRRPKRKLCYLTNKESLSKQWTGTLTLEDVDKIFDDLDSCSQNNPLHSSQSETNHSEPDASPVPQGARLTKETSPCHMGPKGDALLPTTPPTPNVDPDLDILFDVNGPIKTSSPIELNVAVKGVEEEPNEKKQITPPILIDCEDDVKDDTKTQKAQSNGLVTEGNRDCELESPPTKITFSKSMRPSHNNKVEGSCKASSPVEEKTRNKPQTPVVEGKTEPARQENSTPPAKQANRPAPLEKHEGTVHSQPPAGMSTRDGKDKTSFLQKLRLTKGGQPKPACFRKLSPVKVPSPPPEPEDDFLILEDDTPLWFSIPRKTAMSKRGQQSRTASIDKNSSTDKGTEDRSLETVQKEDNQKMKKMKGKEKNELTRPGNDEGDLVSPENLPVSDEVEPAKPNKKNQQTPSKEGDRVKDSPDEEKLSQKVGKKAQKSSETKSFKNSKDRKENAKTSRAKSLKGTKEVMQEPEDMNDTKKNERDSDVTDFGCLTDSKGVEDLAGGNAVGNKLPGASEGTSSEGGQTLGKRKRKQTGQWWLCSQRKEQTETTSNPPTVKKSKQHRKEPRAAELSPVKAKEDGHQSTIQAKEKKPKQKKNRPARGGTPEKRKARRQVVNTNEAEERDEQQQQEAPDQDIDPEQSSPLVISHSEISRTSGDRVFPRVYHNVSNEKPSKKPRHPSPRRPVEQHTAPEAGKRRRKPPGDWWKVNDVSEDMPSTSSQSQQPDPMEPKLDKDRKTQSKQSRSSRLGSPKHGNMLVSSEPHGGAHISPLNVKTLSARKTVKRSLASGKEKFTSAAETRTVVSRRDTNQNNIHDVNGPLVEEVTVTDCASLSKTDKETISMDVGEYRNGSVSHDNHDKPENTLKDLRSGPSSMIELDQHEENDMILPSSTVSTALSVSDLCAPPLRPLTLQPKDKANLTEWLKSLWSTAANNGSDITPDQFDWYFYQGRAIGILVDLSCGSICNGKILLGSYTKKPLWVDHSATTVFNILTSSVNVTIDGTKSLLNSGQSFMVECGHAYSIQNVSAVPAVLCFTRMYAESSD